MSPFGKKAGLWCERRGSNSQGFPHWILSPARLPIPPLSQERRLTADRRRPTADQRPTTADDRPPRAESWTPKFRAICLYLFTLSSLLYALRYNGATADGRLLTADSRPWISNRRIFSFFSVLVSRAKDILECLVKVLDESLDQPVVGEAVIGVVADDHVVQHLNHQELAGPNKIPGQLAVFCRR